MKIQRRTKPLEWNFSETIQTLRGISVFLVYLSHTSFLSTESNLGLAGVCIFFVISGYVITGTLFGTLEKDVTHKSEYSRLLREFYVRRARRLVPMAIVVMILVLAVEYVTSRTETRQLIFVALFVIFYIPNFLGALHLLDSDFPLSHYWSLGVEEQFYLVYPFFVLWLAKFSSESKVKVTMFVLCFFIFSHTLTEFIGKDVRTLPTTYADLLLFGCLVSIIRRYYFIKLERIRLNSYTLLIVSVLSFVLFVLQALLEDKSSYGMGLSNVPRNVLISIFFIAFLGSQSSSKLFKFVGDISYEIYLIHFPILLYCYAFIGTDLFSNVVALFATLVIATFSRRIFKKIQQI